MKQIISIGDCECRIKQVDTSGKKPVSGAPNRAMRGAYAMHHRCQAISTKISVAHLNIRHA
jgi:hypothetical protein